MVSAITIPIISYSNHGLRQFKGISITISTSGSFELVYSVQHYNAHFPLIPAWLATRGSCISVISIACNSKPVVQQFKGIFITICIPISFGPEHRFQHWNGLILFPLLHLALIWRLQCTHPRWSLICEPVSPELELLSRAVAGTATWTCSCFIALLFTATDVPGSSTGHCALDSSSHWSSSLPRAAQQQQW